MRHLTHDGRHTWIDFSQIYHFIKLWISDLSLHVSKTFIKHNSLPSVKSQINKLKYKTRRTLTSNKHKKNIKMQLKNILHRHSYFPSGVKLKLLQPRTSRTEIELTGAEPNVPGRFPARNSFMYKCICTSLSLVHMLCCTLDEKNNTFAKYFSLDVLFQ